MEDLYTLLEPANSFEELFPYPESLDEFEQAYEEIDVGYDCFIADAYVCGPFYIVYDEERFRRDTWGWSAHADYCDNSSGRSVYRTLDGNYKCSSAQEALDSLCDRLEELRSA